MEGRNSGDPSNCDEEEVGKVGNVFAGKRKIKFFTYLRKRVPLTVSLGAVTSYEDRGFNYRQLIALSDRALYDAKEKGRNQLIQTTLRRAKKYFKKK